MNPAFQHYLARDDEVASQGKEGDRPHPAEATRALSGGRDTVSTPGRGTEAGYGRRTPGGVAGDGRGQRLLEFCPRGVPNNLSPSSDVSGHSKASSGQSESEVGQLKQVTEMLDGQFGSSRGQVRSPAGHETAPKLDQWISGIPPELTSVIGAWERLPPAIQAAIITLVDVADPGTTDDGDWGDGDRGVGAVSVQ